MSVVSRLVQLASSGLSVAAIAANTVGSVVVLTLVVVVNADVVARGVFNNPFHGAFEVVQYSMVLIVFLQLPDVVRADRLTRSDGVLVMLAASHPQFGGAIRRLIDLVSATMMVLIAVAMWPEFVDAWETNHFFGTPGIFTAPWWPVRLTIVLSASLCALLWVTKAITGERVLERARVASKVAGV